MLVASPTDQKEVARLLCEASASRTVLEISGNGSKRLWGGPITEASETLSLRGLTRLVEYERNDLTVSVEAGMPFAQLQSSLRENGQMIALDPPYASSATVGGIVAANSSGPMRRRYGTIRDLVIGMTFATLEGKLVSSGGRVVKNTAGLDMAKLMIGSYGTLAAVVSVNLRVHPIPEQWRTFLFMYSDAQSALGKAHGIIQSTLRPACIELFNPHASARLGLRGYCLAIRAAASSSVINRFSRELTGGEELDGHSDDDFWRKVCEFAPAFLGEHAGAVLVRVAAPAADTANLFSVVSGPAVSRCGTGMNYVYFQDWNNARAFFEQGMTMQWRMVVEAASKRSEGKLHWRQSDAAGSNASFAGMKNLKMLFDPNFLLNPGRLYGRI